MYQTGDRVIYGVHGICQIVGIEPMRFGRVRARYYCLQPMDHPDDRYYVPVENKAAAAKLRSLMTRQELTEMLHSDRVHQNVWINDEAQRKIRYRELLAGGDPADLISIIYSLHRHKQEQQNAGRKFHQCDEGFLHDAQKLLNSEFSVVFDLDPKSVDQFILKEMGING